MTQLDGYGEKGAEASRPGYDNTVFWARGGFLYSQSVYRDNDKAYPVYMPMGFGDVTCAMGMMAATVSAVLSARQTGKGDRVSLSLYGTAVWLANILVSGSQYGFLLPKRREDSSPFGAPFKCSDGRWFMPQIVNFSRDAAAYYRLLGADDMAENPLYASRANLTTWRSANRSWSGLKKFLPEKLRLNGKRCLTARDYAVRSCTATVDILRELCYGDGEIKTMLEEKAVKQHEPHK